jgi:hypothetical protein
MKEKDPSSLPSMQQTEYFRILIRDSNRPDKDIFREVSQRHKFVEFDFLMEEPTVYLVSAELCTIYKPGSEYPDLLLTSISETETEFPPTSRLMAKWYPFQMYCVEPSIQRTQTLGFMTSQIW